MQGIVLHTINFHSSQETDKQGILKRFLQSSSQEAFHKIDSRNKSEMTRRDLNTQCGITIHVRLELGNEKYLIHKHLEY
jgi:flagellar motor switch/type III secretory pathway protein FliN